MNLTSQRLLQVMMACAGACALSASAATTWVSDNFEAEGDGYTNALANSKIGYYKMLVTGVQNETTNFAWTADSTDASKVVAGTYEFVGNRPIAGATTAQYLNLETEGQTLSRPVGDPVSFSTANVFVDTLIKFTPSEDTPSIGGDVKVAVYVDAATNLVVYHKYYDGSTLYPTNSTFPGLVTATNWYRLTIEVGNPEFTGPACRVYVNGTKLQHANAFVNADPLVGNGEWFLSAGSGTALSSVQFQGTGAVDELVVADTSDVTGGGTVIMLTLAFDADMINVTTGGVAVAALTQVPDQTVVSIAAKPWYELTSGGALLTGVTSNLVSGSTMVSGVDGTVTGLNGETNEITAKVWSDTGALNVGLGSNQSASKVAAWAIANSVTSLDSNMLDDYLANLAPGTNPQIKINSITVGEDDVTIVVGSTGNAVDFDAINGTIVVYTGTDVGTLTQPGGAEFNVTLAQNETATIVVLKTSGNFVKAAIK